MLSVQQQSIRTTSSQTINFLFVKIRIRPRQSRVELAIGPGQIKNVGPLSVSVLGHSKPLNLG